MWRRSRADNHNTIGTACLKSDKRCLCQQKEIDPERIRTSDLSLRKAALYPAELRGQVMSECPVLVPPANQASRGSEGGEAGRYRREVYWGTTH